MSPPLSIASMSVYKKMCVAAILKHDTKLDHACTMDNGGLTMGRRGSRGQRGLTMRRERLKRSKGAYNGEGGAQEVKGGLQWGGRGSRGQRGALQRMPLQ